MHILIDKTNLRMVGAASTRKWINLVAYVDFPNVETVVVDGQEGRTWTALDRTEMATLYTNMSGQPAPEYGEAIKQLMAYAETWPNPTKSESALEAEAEKIYAEEQANRDENDPVPEPGVTRANHQAIIKAAEAASPEARAATSAALSGDSGQPRERKPADPSAAPKQGITKRIWEIADDLLAVQGSIGNLKEFRKKVIERSAAEGANEGTAATQFGHWKRARGIA